MLPLRLSDIAAACVHLFTALGAVCGLLAALAAFDGAWERMFAWLGLALVIDGIDGTFARMAHVEERLPRFSGERLDLVVDYVTYVFVPALALLRAGYLTGTGGLVIAALILLSSLYHFSDLASKGEDYSFIGFPAVWNIVAFYVFALSPPGWLTYAVLVCLRGADLRADALGASDAREAPARRHARHHASPGRSPPSPPSGTASRRRCGRRSSSSRRPSTCPG